jgi:hypothetical protein
MVSEKLFNTIPCGNSILGLSALAKIPTGIFAGWKKGIKTPCKEKSLLI